MNVAFFANDNKVVDFLLVRKTCISGSIMRAIKKNKKQNSPTQTVFPQALSLTSQKKEVCQPRQLGNAKSLQHLEVNLRNLLIRPLLGT